MTQPPPCGPPPGQPWSGQSTSFPPPPQKQGKPVYLRPWFAVLALFLVVGVIGSTLDRDDQRSETEASAVTSASESSTSAVPSPQQVAPPTSTVPPAPVAAPTTTVAPTTPVVDFAMPLVVGMNLQDAQNLIQTNGVWLSLSHDLLGMRTQLVDANWRVCTQNVPAGQQVIGDVEGAIDLGVVKLEEPCP